VTTSLCLHRWRNGCGVPVGGGSKAFSVLKTRGVCGYPCTAVHQVLLTQARDDSRSESLPRSARSPYGRDSSRTACRFSMYVKSWWLSPDSTVSTLITTPQPAGQRILQKQESGTKNCWKRTPAGVRVVDSSSLHPSLHTCHGSHTHTPPPPPARAPPPPQLCRGGCQRVLPAVDGVRKMAASAVVRNFIRIGIAQ
jgi:hypothetical protein